MTQDTMLASAISPFSSSDPLILLRELHALREELQQLKESNRALEDRIIDLEKDRDLAADQDLNQLHLIAELRAKVFKQEEESPLVEKLYNEMKIMGRKQVSFSDAAKILKVSPSWITRIKTAIVLDGRFEIVKAEGHKQKKLIRIRKS